MSYESAMGQELYGAIPPRRRVVEVYGTMPEAQEYIAEEFGLPGLPPAYMLTPPGNPRTDPYRRVSVIPIKPAMGTDDASSRQPWHERHRGWVIAGVAGAIAFMIVRSRG